MTPRSPHDPGRHPAPAYATRMPRMLARCALALALLGALFLGAGCVTEGEVSPILTVQGTIAYATYSSGDIVVQVVDTTGAVVSTSTIAVTTAPIPSPGPVSVPFSVVVESNSGLFMVKAWNDVVPDGTLDPSFERMASRVFESANASFLGITLNLGLYHAITGNVHQTDWSAGVFAVQATVLTGGIDVALASAAGGRTGSAYTMLVPASSGSITLYGFNDKDGDGVDDGGLLESYGTTGASMATADVTRDLWLTHDVEVSGTLYRPFYTSGSMVIESLSEDGTVIHDTQTISGGTQQVTFTTQAPVNATALITVFNDANNSTAFDALTELSSQAFVTVGATKATGVKLYMLDPSTLTGLPGNWDFDAGTLGTAPDVWTVDGLWHVSTQLPANGTHSVWYGDTGTTLDYDVKDATYLTTSIRNSGSLTSPTITLDGDPQMFFNFALTNECAANAICDFDQLKLQISTDAGVTWKDVAQLENTSGAFRNRVVDLSTYASKAVLVRFFFDTIDDVKNAYEGAFIDDIGFQ